MATAHPANQPPPSDHTALYVAGGAAIAAWLFWPQISALLTPVAAPAVDTGGGDTTPAPSPAPAPVPTAFTFNFPDVGGSPTSSVPAPAPPPPTTTAAAPTTTTVVTRAVNPVLGKKQTAVVVAGSTRSIALPETTQPVKPTVIGDRGTAPVTNPKTAALSGLTHFPYAATVFARNPGLTLTPAQQAALQRLRRAA